MSVLMNICSDHGSVPVCYDDLDEALDISFEIACVIALGFCDHQSIDLVWHGHTMRYRFPGISHLESNFYYVVTDDGLVVFASVYRSDCERFVRNYPYKCSIREFVYQDLAFVSQADGVPV